MSAEGGVSIVIPVYNGSRTIAQTIDAALRQSHPAIEIIVVDDGSSDETPRIVESFGEKVKLLRKPNGGPASARNVGIRVAVGEFIAFTDSDCLPVENWLAEILVGFDAPDVAGVGGIVRGVGDEWVGRYVDSVKLLDAPHEKSEAKYLITANACFRRAALLDAGLFDERFRKPGGEEPDLCKRISLRGNRFAFREEALVRHHHKQTVRILLKTMGNYGEGNSLLARNFPEYALKEDVGRLIRRRMFGLKNVARGVVYQKRKYGWRLGVGFAFLAWLSDIAYLRGYRRGMQRDQGAVGAAGGK